MTLYPWAQYQWAIIRNWKHALDVRMDGLIQMHRRSYRAPHQPVLLASYVHIPSLLSGLAKSGLELVQL